MNISDQRTAMDGLAKRIRASGFKVEREGLQIVIRKKKSFVLRISPRYGNIESCVHLSLKVRTPYGGYKSKSDGGLSGFVKFDAVPGKIKEMFEGLPVVEKTKNREDREEILENALAKAIQERYPFHTIQRATESGRHCVMVYTVCHKFSFVVTIKPNEITLQLPGIYETMEYDAANPKFDPEELARYIGDTARSTEHLYREMCREVHKAGKKWEEFYEARKPVRG